MLSTYGIKKFSIRNNTFLLYKIKEHFFIKQENNDLSLSPGFRLDEIEDEKAIFRFQENELAKYLFEYKEALEFVKKYIVLC